MNKEIFKDISYGMYIVSAYDNKNVGCVINTFSQLTSNDALVSICLNKDNYTNKVIKKTNKFGVSILPENINPNIISKFGFSSSKDVDKFDGLNYTMVDEIPILKENICGYFVCEVKEIIDLGSHDLIISKVKNAEKLNDFTPMTYKYYHEVIKGKSPEKAPTYIEEEVKEENTYVCDICGYVHYGDLPDDFVCPVCGAPKNLFNKK